MDTSIGQPCITPAHSASVLCETWRPKFQDQEIDPEEVYYFLENYAIDLSEIDFAIDKDMDLDCIIQHHKRSSPGPDGIHYAFWAAT